MAGQQGGTGRPPGDAGPTEWQIVGLDDSPQPQPAAQQQPPPAVVQPHLVPPPGYPQPYLVPYPQPYLPYQWLPRPPPNPVRWLNPLVVFLLFIVAIIIAVECFLPVAIMLYFNSPTNWMTALTTPIMLLVLLVIQDSWMVVVPYLVYFKTKILTWADISKVKISGLDGANRVGLGILVGLAYSAVVMAITKYINYKTSGGLQNTTMDTLPNYIFMLLGGAVVAPLTEEFFFRGVALRGVMKWLEHKQIGYSFLYAMLFSTTLFAMVHGYDIFGTVVVFIGGIIFAILYYKTDSLVTPIVAHAVYNGVLITAEYMKFI